MSAPTMLPPLWRCPACGLKTRDEAVVLAHATLPPSSLLGPHRMYAPPHGNRVGLRLEDGVVRVGWPG